MLGGLAQVPVQVRLDEVVPIALTPTGRGVLALSLILPRGMAEGPVGLEGVWFSGAPLERNQGDNQRSGWCILS
jgi:hypothetical protein